MKNKSKVGLFGVGLSTYWAQFDGLKDRLTAYQAEIKNKIEDFGVDVVDVGLIDDPELARTAADVFVSKQVDIIFCYISTYALSHTVLPVVQKTKCPVIILNIQPTKTMDFERFNKLKDRGKMTGDWLANCQACSAPEIACVLNRAGIKFQLITGWLDDAEAWGEIHDWIDASNVAVAMRNNRCGVLGHYYGGMLDVYSDMTQIAATFGNHFEILEMCELNDLRQKVTEDEILAKIDQFNQEFEVLDSCEESEIRRAAQTSVALDKIVNAHNIDSMAYYYDGINGNDYQNVITSVIAGNTLLTAHNIPVAGECEVKNVQAMKIMDVFGAGGSFSEPYGIDFENDIVMWGHDGPAHFSIAEEKVKLVPLSVYHGKPGKGLSIEMRVKNGPVTLFALVQSGDRKLKFLVAEGETVPGPIFEIGNTNSRYKFPISAKQFMNDWCMAGPAHHCAIGVGHIATKIAKLAAIYDIEIMNITGSAGT
jgi:L-arabinose isomerase